MASGPVRVETVGLPDYTTDFPEIQDEWPQPKSTNTFVKIYSV